MGKTPAQEMKKKLTATKKLMAEEAKKTKWKKDLAFGLKNQKGAKQALNVDRLRHAAAMAGRTKEQVAADEARKEKQRERARLKKEGWTEEELLLGKKVVDNGKMRLPEGVDPKTVLCGYYKAGKCKKGNKCKFSHNMDIERQSKNKKSLYEDPRETDTIDKWDTAKLEDVVGKKEMTNPNATQIVCKYFLEAIETRKYGWFWKCENGKECLYQHKLPPGFILKADLDEEQKIKDETDPCDYVEMERAKLDRSKCTPVTLENFLVWKAAAKKKKEEEILKQAQMAQKTSNKKNKHHRIGMTGRTLFTFRPNLFQDDEGAAEDGDYEEEPEENEGDEKEEETETKVWRAQAAPVMDEADFLAALKLQEEGGDEEEAEKGEEKGDGAADAAGGDEAAPAEEKTATEEAPAEPEKKVETAEEKKARLKAKREEKRLAKLQAKLDAKKKPMTAFEKKQAGLA